MCDILYKNATFFQNEILPYSFLLEGKDYIMLIKTSEHDFCHLIGKQYSKNLMISKMKPKEFYEKVLTKDVSYQDLTNFDIDAFSKEYKWIENKNSVFIELFTSFINEINLKMYRINNYEIYTNIDMDYYHQKGNENISILGIIGNNTENSFSFNSILSNNDEDLQKRFSKNKPILILKNHRVKNSQVQHEIKKINLKLKESPRNNKNQSKNKSKRNNNMLSNQDIKYINQLLLDDLKIDKGENGKKSIKIIKDGKIIEKGIRLNNKNLDTVEKIAEYVNDTYGKNR